MKYTSLTVQGNIISEELLQQIESGKATGQLARDFGMKDLSQLRSEMEYAWSRIRLDWKHFSEKKDSLPENDPYGTTLARRWMEQFFKSLGFDLVKEKAALTGGNGQTYVISHTADNLHGLPVHIVGFNDPAHPDKNTLDQRSSGGTSRLSPHATMQEYLNVTEHLYGLVTNGLYLRLLRDSGRLTRLSYLEFDLRRLLDDDKYNEFALLFRLLHASRFPATPAEAEKCWLEQYYQQSIEAGNRIREGLSQAVKQSLMALGNGFLQHEANDALREKLRNQQLLPRDFFRQLLRVVYRLLFLMVTEERDLIYDPSDKSESMLRLKNIYLQHYSISRLRRLSQKRHLSGTGYSDLWQALVQTFRLFEASGQGKNLGIQPLDGDLFSPDAIGDLETCQLSNELLLKCMRNLHEFEDEDHNRVSISYRALDVEELGSVYEGLLDLFPVFVNLDSDHPGRIAISFHGGTDRKTTGSYYTRPELVNELVQSALVPVIEQRLQMYPGDREAQYQALLRIKVCDPAAGSGHMLLASARTLAWHLARVKSGEDNPPPSLYRTCLREAIQHCIYGVDLNPDAVELCKLALWIEGHNSGKPLSFLDHKIRCGNSLVGVVDPEVLSRGIPSEAFEPVNGDDRAVCRQLKTENRRFLISRQTTFDFDRAELPLAAEMAVPYREIENLPQDNVEAVQRARDRFRQMRRDPAWLHQWQACNLWTAAFFWNYSEENRPLAPTSQRLSHYLAHPGEAPQSMLDKANALSLHHRFFHWHLEFPDVWAQGGFDVMLGNPPWERIKLQQEEFFATRNPEVALAPNAAERRRRIQQLQQSNPALYAEYLQALHTADATGKFLRESGRFELTAVGDLNTYAVFAELFASLVNDRGKAAFIVPTGIATDDSNKAFFGHLIDSQRLESLFDFENREKIFRDVDSRTKFCLLTLRGRGSMKSPPPRFAFFLTRVEQLQDPLRVFSLTSEDFLRLNPNTRTCPVFRTRVDAQLTTDIYRRVPVLINERTGENPWGVRFMRMFDMSNDSHLFRTRAQLEAEGFTLWGNRMVRWETTPGGERKIAETWLPLYEGKMIWHYDHRFGTYAGVENRNSSHLPTPFPEQYQDPCFQVLPWYWVEESWVRERTQAKWLIGFRDIARSTDERTFIVSINPFSAVNHKEPLIFSVKSSGLLLLLVSNLSSMVFDFYTRQKVGGTSMTFFYVRQFPVLLPSMFSIKLRLLISIFTFELIYTSWDIKAFADDIWKEADEELKAALVSQWEENRAATGGNEWAPPAWHDDHGRKPEEVEGCPLPPFRWDEERRARLRAELDAIYAHLYGLSRKQLRYILDPADLTPAELENILDPREEVDNPLDPEGYAQRCRQSTFPGETFRVLKDNEMRQYGEYRTRRLVLEAWERLHQEGILSPWPAGVG